MNLLKSVSIYSFGSILTIGIPLLVLPLLTYYLNPEDYGMLRLISAFAALSTPFVGLVSHSLAGIEYFKQEETEFQSLFTSFIRIPFFNALVYSIILLTFKDTISSWTGIPANWILVIPAIALGTIVTEVCANMLTLQKKAIAFVKFSVGRAIVETGVTVFLVVQLGMSWQGRMSSWLITLILFGVISIAYFRRQGWFSGSISKSWTRQALVFGIPLIPHVIGNFIINQSDILFISKMISLEATGLYGVGYQFGLMVSIVSGAFLQYMGPYVNERLADITEAKKREIVKLSYIYIGTLALSVVANILIADFFFDYMLDPQYANGVIYVAWVALGYFFWGCYSVFARYIFFYKRTKILTLLSVISISLNLILNYTLIPKFGALGAAYATVISFAIVLLGVIVASWRIYPMPWFYFMDSSSKNP